MPLYTPRIPLIGSGQTVTASAPLLNLTQTWNNAAAAFTGLKFNVTDTASASGSLLMDLQADGASQFNVTKTGNLAVGGGVRAGSSSGTTAVALSFYTGGLEMGSAAQVYWTATGPSGTPDLVLRRDAANTLALRNGTAAQKLSVYNTYTDASNYERGVFDWAGTANTLRIGTEAAGTGTVRNIQLVAGSNTVTMTPGASNLLTLNGGLAIGGSFIVGSNSSMTFYGRAGFLSPVDGVIRASNNAGGDFTRLILGPNDASGVAIKKNGTAFNFVLGNDTGDAAITASKITTSDTAFLHNTSAALANGAAAQVATMTNGPTAGNPTKWIAINDNGVTRYLPAW